MGSGHGCEYLAGLYRMRKHDSNIEVGHRSPVVCTAGEAKAILALPPDIVAPGRNTDCAFLGELGSGKRLQAPNERNLDVVVTNGRVRPGRITMLIVQEAPLLAACLAHPSLIR